MTIAGKPFWARAVTGYNLSHGVFTTGNFLLLPYSMKR